VTVTGYSYGSIYTTGGDKYDVVWFPNCIWKWPHFMQNMISASIHLHLKITHCLLVLARTTTSLVYSYGFLNIAQTLLPVFTHDVTGSDDLLTYLPHPTLCFALGSRLNRQWSPLCGYRPFINPPLSPRKITYIYNTMLNFISVSFFTAYIIFTFRVRVSLGLDSVVKVRGDGGSAPCSDLSPPPAIVYMSPRLNL